jgi:hypothetical protein
MKVCIVGASGKLGRHMVRQALDRGLVRTTHGGQHTGFQPKLGAPSEGGRFASGICAGWLRTDGRLARRNLAGEHRDLQRIYAAGSRPRPRERDQDGIGAKPAVVYVSTDNKRCRFAGCFFTGATGLEPATSGVTGRRSNQLNYAP